MNHCLRNVYYLLLSVVLIIPTVKAQIFNTITSPTTQNLKSVYFLNADTGFIGGGSSTSCAIFRTYNGGNTWTALTAPTSNAISKIHFLTKDSGYIFTSNSQLYKTTDGGNTWMYIRNFSANVMFFLNSSVGYLRGSNYVYRTLNGGLNWDSISLAPTGSPTLNWYEIHFVTQTTGFTSNMTGSIWKTTNLGASWSLLYTFPGPPSSFQAYGFKMYDANLGIAAYDTYPNVSLWRTTNGGATWNNLFFINPISGSSSLKILFTSKKKVFIFSAGDAYMSNDTGNTWTVVNGLGGSDLFMVNDSVGYAVANNGYIYKTSSGMVMAPTSAASTFFIGNITNTAMQLNWTNGNGTGRIVVACATTNTIIAPSYGNAYTAGAFGAGSQIGAGNYVVYNGTGNSCVVTGLNYNTAYYYRVYEYNGTGVNTNYLTASYATNGAMTLPVRLLSFIAEKENNEVNLKWQTASEVNNDYFEIERSEVGGQRLENWKLIGKVTGHGNSNVVNSYQYSDPLSDIQPLTSNIYYRFKQVDFDGKHEYSNIVAVTNNSITNNEIIISPNPSKNELNIRTNSHEILNFQLYDITGKIILEDSFIQHSTLSIQHLQSGIYFYKLINRETGSIKTGKWVKE